MNRRYGGWSVSAGGSYTMLKDFPKGYPNNPNAPGAQDRSTWDFKRPVVRRAVGHSHHAVGAPPVGPNYARTITWRSRPVVDRGTITRHLSRTVELHPRRQHHGVRRARREGDRLPGRVAVRLFVDIFNLTNSAAYETINGRARARVGYPSPPRSSAPVRHASDSGSSWLERGAQARLLWGSRVGRGGLFAGPPALFIDHTDLTQVYPRASDDADVFTKGFIYKKKKKKESRADLPEVGFLKIGVISVLSPGTVHRSSRRSQSSRRWYAAPSSRGDSATPAGLHRDRRAARTSRRSSDLFDTNRSASSAVRVTVRSSRSRRAITAPAAAS